MKVLLADDEPFYLDWLVDYLESKGVEVEIATTVDDAILKVAKNSYRFIVVDLNIPILKDGSKYSKHITGAYSEYPGLYIANFARNAGYRTKQVIVYSVFNSAEIEAALSKIYCTYITKGHPIDMKREVDHVLQYDPTQD